MLIRWYLVFLVALLVPITAYALCVDVPTANLRSGPGTKYKMVWTVYRYMPFQEIRSSGNWFAVRDIDGYTEWIYRPLVTSRYRCAAVRSRKANIRSGPGINYPVKYEEPATKYDSFRVLKRKGAWIKVQDEYGDTGWIHRKLLWVQ